MVAGLWPLGSGLWALVWPLRNTRNIKQSCGEGGVALIEVWCGRVRLKLGDVNCGGVG